tara:strand:+ start:9604 stop:9819 length:216 start_codon:yes stop_codon:yes gene_type:complete
MKMMNKLEQLKTDFDTKIFPVAKTRNNTADSIVANFDGNGNLLPSCEEERWAVSRELWGWIVKNFNPKQDD